MSQSTVNEAGNEGGSVTVGLPSTDVREMLGNLRRQHGADSPIGRRCTNLLEQTERYAKETDLTVRRNLAVNMERQMSDLAALRRGDR